MRVEVAASFLIIVIGICFQLGCRADPSDAGTGTQEGVEAPIEINPFRDLQPVPIDGRSHALEVNFAALGSHQIGTVLRINVEGEGFDQVLVLAEDNLLVGQVGRLAGGGLPGAPFDYRIPQTGEYFVFLPLAAGTTQARGSISLSQGDPTFEPPQTQIVLVAFEDGFLTSPGLFDASSMDEAEFAFLESISGQVSSEVVGRLAEIFEGTPIVVVGPDQPPPVVAHSTLSFSPKRAEAAAEGFDSVYQAPLTSFAPEECKVSVLFGEVLPPNFRIDPGNRVLDDAAVVYVGSFQGRGEPCRTAVTNSVNNIVLALAHSGAHEIGHVVGLFHVPHTDIMQTAVSGSFQTQLGFGRGQLLLAGAENDAIFTNVIQDPAFYFQSIFAN